MTKTKTLFSLSAILTLLAISCNALAHPGHEYSEITHSLLHIIISAGVGISLITAGYLLFQRLPKAIKQKVRK